jgi:hypothetical protein
MPKTDAYEADLLAAFDAGALKSVATKAELAKFKAAGTRHCGEGQAGEHPPVVW